MSLNLIGDSDSQTRMLAEFIATACRDAGLDTADVVPSGNVVDGPGWTFRATSHAGVSFGIEVAGPPHTDSAG
jgi:hypothetical protein